MFDLKQSEVKEIKWKDNEDARDMILNKHYAQRKPSVSFIFGIYINGELKGVCSFGKPASNSLCIGICGKEKSNKVYELNRLFIENDMPKNTASYFVSKCLKKLKKHKLIIVSYSDTGMYHNGYIYQASNFIYTGKTKGRTDKYTENNKHSRHYDDVFNHLRKVRTPKHRYVYFLDKKDIKFLNYPILKYPKGKNEKYEIGQRQKTEIYNKESGESYFI